MSTRIHVLIEFDGPISADTSKAAVSARGALFVDELRKELLDGAEAFGSTAPIGRARRAWGMGRAHVERVVHVTTEQLDEAP